jgi:predicted nucleic acid-binding protein
MATPTAQAIVLDAGAVLETVLPDSAERQAKALALLDAISTGGIVAHVPIIFFNEVAAACARAERGKRLKRADAVAFLDRLGRVPVSLSVDILPAAYWFERAMKLHCQVADGAYLALALDLKAPIATFDGGLATAARSNKAKLYFAR